MDGGDCITAFANVIGKNSQMDLHEICRKSSCDTRKSQILGRWGGQTKLVVVLSLVSFAALNKAETIENI